MSKIHFTAGELSNIISALNGPLTSRDQARVLADILAAVSVTNTAAFNAHYGERETPATAADILSSVSLAADFGRACATAYMLESNCEGMMPAELSAQVGRCILGRLLERAVTRLAESRESVAYLQDKLARSASPRPRKGARA